jgi:hypothetical protein
MKVRTPPRGSTRAWLLIAGFLVAGVLLVTGLLLGHTASRPLGIALFFIGCAGCFGSALAFYLTSPRPGASGR